MTTDVQRDLERAIARGEREAESRREAEEASIAFADGIVGVGAKLEALRQALERRPDLEHHKIVSVLEEAIEVFETELDKFKARW